MDNHHAHYRLVRASAGTGKTHTLTTRYLALLRAGVDPASILATTFTRKAAGEIFERVLTRLALAVLDDASRDKLQTALLDDGLLRPAGATLDAPAVAAMQALLIDRLDRAAISTIDGFFARLCNAFALELRLPIDPTLTDDGSALAAELREAAIEAMLAQAADDGFTALLTLLRQLHHDSARRSVTGSLDRIFRGDADGLYTVFRQAPDSDTWPRLDTPPRLSDDQLQNTAQQLADAERLLPTTKLGKTDARWAKALTNVISQSHARQWEPLTNTGLVKAALQTGTYYGAPLPPPLLELCTTLGNHALAEQIDLLNLQHRSAWELLHRYAKHFQHRCRQQRVLLFADLTDALARQLRLLDLGHHTDGSDPVAQAWRDELAYRIDGRVEHLLIDEFQDTSIDQFAVLWPLIDEATADHSADRTLLVVGDAKQSIYGWRGGRVELFGAVHERLEPRGLDEDELHLSYRSSSAVLHLVNAVFRQLDQNPAWNKHLEAKARFAADFEPHESAKPELAGECLLLTTDRTDEDAPHTNDHDEPQPDDPHADATAQHLAQLAERWPHASLAVLVRTNAQANTILHACRALRLTVSGETGVALTDHPAVNAALAALRLADHPGDDIAAFHVAQTPLGQRLRLPPHDPAAARRVSAQLRRDLAARGYAGLLADWLVDLAPHCDAYALARLGQLVRLAENYRPVTTLRPRAFVRYVEAARVEDPAAGRIRVMTVHRAKGLEFDAVVLPYLHTDRPYKTVLLEDRDGDTGPITAVYRAGRSELREHLPILHSLHENAESRHAYEQLCTLYVALTRAKTATHILMPPAGKRDPRDANNALALVLSALLTDNLDLTAPHTTLYRHAAHGGADTDLAKPASPSPAQPAAHHAERDTAPCEWPLSPARSRSASHAAPSSTDATIDDLLRADAGESPRRAAFGSSVHAALRSLRFLDDADPLAGEADNPVADDPEVAEHLHAALRCPPIRDALQRRGAAEVRREVPVLYRDSAGRTMRGIIDRLVWWTDPQGEPLHAEVQDFKTDRPADNASPSSLDAWLNQRRDHHAPQLDGYRRAAAAWLGLDEAAVDRLLLFTSPGRCVCW